MFIMDYGGQANNQLELQAEKFLLKKQQNKTTENMSVE